MFSANNGVTSGAVFIEDVFSTYLYTGNGSTQTITNGIDLAGKGGLVWLKNRGSAISHCLQDTERGPTKQLYTNSTATEQTRTTGVTSFNAAGFTLGDGSETTNLTNTLNQTYVSLAFRQQPKFFDVVTYTGTGANRTVSHSLGSVPGCIIVKRTDASDIWQVYHTSLGATQRLQLNNTNAAGTNTTLWNSTAPTESVFSLGTDTSVNASGGTYVAYLFAHNAGGFGLTGTDSVISCGSYTGNGNTSGPVVDLGWEPQFILYKRTDSTGNWYIVDNMRNMSQTATAYLRPNTDEAEVSLGASFAVPLATGFQITGTGTDINASGGNYIYIAIRRGPMKVPTDGTKVYSASQWASGSGWSTGFPVDANINTNRYSEDVRRIACRLAGNVQMYTNLINSEVAQDYDWDDMSGLGRNNGFDTFGWNFRRAPGFFDVVCYTGNGTVARQVPHNLTVKPELIITKVRNVSGDWPVAAAAVESVGSTPNGLLNTNGDLASANYGLSCKDSTTTTFYTDVKTNYSNESGKNYVAYLFATCPGVSKVGSYTGTGTGTTQQINCGFTAGARFVLIKRTDSTGDWYVWDSTRGIVAGNDPYLLLNTVGSEVNTDYIDTYSAGFEISSTAPAAINANGGKFIYLAIA